MNWLVRTFGSSIGSKVIMAVTGFGLFGFLLGHLSGNLLTFLGADAFNTYAHGMQSLGGLLWVARLGLLGMLALHIMAAIRLTSLNRAARPEAYRHSNTVQASFASRTMIYSGLIVAAFIAFHLAHYTLHLVDPSFGTWTDAQGRHDAYRMLVVGFQSPLVSGFYILAMVLIGMHLNHGVRSLFQSLGLSHPNFTPLVQKAVPILCWALVLGFISIPVAVMSGLMSYTGGAH